MLCIEMYTCIHHIHTYTQVHAHIHHMDTYTYSFYSISIHMHKTCTHVYLPYSYILVPVHMDCICDHLSSLHLACIHTHIHTYKWCKFRSALTQDLYIYAFGLCMYAIIYKLAWILCTHMTIISYIYIYHIYMQAGCV